MKRVVSLIVFYTACIYTVSSMAAVDILDVRIWPSPDNTRLVFDLSAPVTYHITTLHQPERLVIDMGEVKTVEKVDLLDLSKTAIKSVRYGELNDKTIRLVFDLFEPVTTKTFTLKPGDKYHDRLVIDLSSKPATKTKIQTITPVVEAKEVKARDFIIAVDPGHGGEDPGATGRHGYLEKDVVLQIGQKLAHELTKYRGMKPFLVRNGDYYVGLQKRVEKARRAQADLFISIHADAFRDNRARGASIYTLSPKGASSEAARWLAEKENQADLIGGVSLDDKDEILASVLLDLSQTASNEASNLVGKTVLSELKSISPLHNRRVQQAGFVVLKSPDIPSMLIETGFISNNVEEQELVSPKYQAQLADAIARGVNDYFKDKPKPVVNHKTPKPKAVDYRVQAGDTLGKIAQRFNTSSVMLKDMNHLSNDKIIIGQLMKIPSPTETSLS